MTDDIGAPLDGVTLQTVADPSAPTPQSAAAILRTAHARARAERKPKDIVIPGYGEPESELHVEYRAIEDYEEVRNELTRSLKKGQRQALAEIEVGKQTLLLAATGSYALVGGERVDTGCALGLALHGYLFPDGQVLQDGAPPVHPTNDGQALVCLYHLNTTVLMAHYRMLDMWMLSGGYESEDGLLGN